MGNYISYFKESIKNADLRKAKDLLLDLHLESEEAKVAILNELAMVPDELAWLLLDLLVRLETKYYKSFSIDTYDKLIQLITDRAHLNFEFAMILYKTRDRKKLLQASPLMKYILTNCTDREILFETINAVGNEKIESLATAIAEFLYYDDTTLKERSVKNLTLIASPEAYKILFDASQTVKNDQTIMDALELLKADSGTVALTDFSEIDSVPVPPTDLNQINLDSNHLTDLNGIGSTSNIESDEFNTEQAHITDFSSSDSGSHQIIEADKILASEYKTDLPDVSVPQKYSVEMLGSKSIEERFEAFRYFVKSGSGYLKELVANLRSQDHDLIVNTFRIISNVASENILPDIYSFLGKNSQDPSLEHEAFEALCSFDKFSFTELMLGAIEKPAIHVRMSSIKALDKNYNDPVYAKVKNRIETGREQGETLVRTIIDSHAENLINYLLVSDTFADMAATYLAKEVTPSTLNKYLDVLIKRGLKATAKKIEAKADMDSKLKNRLKAMVISSSDTVQKIYDKLLFKNGYISIGFQSPEDAFESLSIDKPDLIVSDLFAKDMTALDFAKEVREFYTKNELPFLISTRQNDFLNIDLAKQYPACDISGIFKFPGVIKGINELIN